MDKVSLRDVGTAQADRAGQAGSGRSAHTVYGGHDRHLRQTLVALSADSVLADHESPGEATVQVLSGRLRLVAGDASCEGGTGDLLVVPPARHRVEALEDTTFLLTVVHGA